MDLEKIQIENEILDRLSGNVFLLQDLEQKREVIFKVFLEVYNSPEFQKSMRKSAGVEMDNYFKEFMSYGIINEFLDDPAVEDIMINYLSPIFIHKSKVGLVKTEKRFQSRQELDLFIKKLIVFSGRKTIHKINNVELADVKGRVNIVYSPYGPQITITRAKEKPLSVIELIKNGTLSPEMVAQFWLYVEGLGIKPANLLIAGGPGAGKTTLLNALFSFIPSNERIVAIEDTLELNTDLLEDNCSRLESDQEITLADLVKNSLRMRPDRVVVGEVRGVEAQDLMTAMNIGKYCMGTLHASTAREAVMRLENEPMNVPSVLINLVDVFVIMRRVTYNGKIYRVVGEMVETGGMEQNMVLLSSLWTCDLSTLEFKQSGIGSIFRDRLAQISGKNPKDIINELKLRTKIIKLLMEKNIEDIESVTKFFRSYAIDSKKAITGLGMNIEDLLKLNQ